MRICRALAGLFFFCIIMLMVLCGACQSQAVKESLRAHNAILEEMGRKDRIEKFKEIFTELDWGKLIPAKCESLYEGLINLKVQRDYGKFRMIIEDGDHTESYWIMSLEKERLCMREKKQQPAGQAKGGPK